MEPATIRRSTRRATSSAELKAASDAQGIRFGLYYSITDWHEQDAGMPADQMRKNLYAQLKELITTYHPALLWFDGQGTSWWTTAEGEDLQTYLRGLDPNLVINNRVTKNRVVDGDYTTPERERNIPTAPVKGAPWESCLTTGNRWAWTRYDTWKPTAALTRDLLEIVGRDGNLLLNIGPDHTGVIPAAAANQLRGIGNWLNSNGNSAAVYGSTYTGLVDDPAWGVVTRNGNKLYLALYDWPATGSPLHLTVHDGFTISAARMLGSTSPVSWKASGDGYDITPSGKSTSSVATVIELTVAMQAGAGVGTGTGLRAQYWTNTDPGRELLGAVDGLRPGAVHRSTHVRHGVRRDRAGVDRRQAGHRRQYAAQREGGLRHGRPVTGTKYSIRVDYTEHTGEACLKLLWLNPNRRQRIIPTSQLYPAAA